MTTLISWARKKKGVVVSGSGDTVTLASTYRMFEDQKVVITRTKEGYEVRASVPVHEYGRDGGVVRTVGARHFVRSFKTLRGLQRGCPLVSSNVSMRAWREV